MPQAVKFAYYCSGHGYGHATRVSAFASSLLSLDVKPSIHVVSSAPSHVFSECIQHGAHYRNVDVDPIVVQPLAYKVDRQKSFQALQAFLSQKEERLAAEVTWLLSERIDCVLSDAAFLACEAATKAGIPSILITNFTFDSVYSYLGTEMTDGLPNASNDSLQIPNATPPLTDLEQDFPIPEDLLVPLVSQLFTGYRHADVLLLLPGFIPIPSFFESISLPAPAWVDMLTNRFKPDVESMLRSLPTDHDILPSIPFPGRIIDASLRVEHRLMTHTNHKKPPRTVKFAPLLVRPVSANIHTPEGRSSLLSSIGIPEDLHDHTRTQILVVSFGGQKIRRPYGGKSPSRVPSPSRETSGDDSLEINNVLVPAVRSRSHRRSLPRKLSRSISTKMFIPGAPAPVNSPTFTDQETFAFSKAESSCGAAVLPADSLTQDEPSLLPSSSWIAIICGVTSNWSISEDNEELPTGFYVAPSDIYMPDLTAIADVLMGKLGYGTVSECVAQSTPMIYVPRPLFVEEHGLRLFLEAEGIGIELSRDEYESGAWANKVEAAYRQGKERGRNNHGSNNAQKVQELASWVVENVEEWRSQFVDSCVQY